MKNKKLFFFLVVEAVVVSLTHCLGEIAPRLFTSALAFPFEQIGYGIGALARTGTAGSGFASMLLIGISLLPIIPMLRRWHDRERRGEHVALALLSLVLLPVLCCMSSPDLIVRRFSMIDTQMLPSVKMTLGGSVWTVALCWMVLMLLRLFRTGGRKRMLVYMRRLMSVLCMLFIAAIFGTCLGEMISGIRAAQQPADGFMAAGRFAAGALPYFADIAVAVCAGNLLNELSEGVSDNAVLAAGRLSRVSASGLAAVVVSGAVLSLIQLAAAPLLSDLRTEVNIPVLSLVFVLAALLFSRIIAENKRLSDDNDLFI